MRKQRNQNVYTLYIYTRSGKNQIFKLSWFIDSLSFDPFICYNIDSYFIGTCFSQDFFKWWCLESKINNFQRLCSSFLELEDERIRMPLQCIRIRLPGIRMLLPASEYSISNSFVFCDFQLVSSISSNGFML